MGHDSDLHKGPGMVPRDETHRDPMLERDYEELERSWARWKDLALKLERRVEKAEAERDALQADLDECWNAPLDEEVLTLRTRALREKAEAERDEARRDYNRFLDRIPHIREQEKALRTRVEALEKWVRESLDSCSLPGGDREIDGLGIATGPCDCALCDSGRALLNTEVSPMTDTKQLPEGVT